LTPRVINPAASAAPGKAFATKKFVRLLRLILMQNVKILRSRILILWMLNKLRRLGICPTIL
jgi:hypothetical protein